MLLVAPERPFQARYTRLSMCGIVGYVGGRDAIEVLVAVPVLTKIQVEAGPRVFDSSNADSAPSTVQRAPARYKVQQHVGSVPTPHGGRMPDSISSTS